jgi:hypothetical protein
LLAASAHSQPLYLFRRAFQCLQSLLKGTYALFQGAYVGRPHRLGQDSVNFAQADFFAAGCFAKNCARISPLTADALDSVPRTPVIDTKEDVIPWIVSKAKRHALRVSLTAHCLRLVLRSRGGGRRHCEKHESKRGCQNWEKKITHWCPPCDE